MDLSFVKNLKIQSLQDILKSLVASVANGGSENPLYPYVTVTTNNFGFSGIPVRIESIRSESFLILVDPERGLNGQDALTYLPLNSVLTVSVTNFRHHLHALSSGLPPRLAQDEAPSKLTLDRETKALGSKLGVELNIFSLMPGAEDGIRHYTSRFLKELELAFQRLKEDRLGQEALAKISAVHLNFSSDARLSARREGSALYFTLGYEQNQNCLGSDLTRELERVL